MALDRMLKAELKKEPAGETNSAIEEQLSRLSDAFGPIVDIQPEQKRRTRRVRLITTFRKAILAAT